MLIDQIMTRHFLTKFSIKKILLVTQLLFPKFAYLGVQISTKPLGNVSKKRRFGIKINANIISWMAILLKSGLN